jgi:hypothetical protein
MPQRARALACPQISSTDVDVSCCKIGSEYPPHSVRHQDCERRAFLLGESRRRLPPHRLAIFITGEGHVPMAVESMQAGAGELLTNPCSDAAMAPAIA